MAYRNLISITERIKTLEELYHQVPKTSNRFGYGTKNNGSEPVTYSETMLLVGTFLKTVGGELPSELEIQVDVPYRIIQALKPRDNKLQFENIVDPYIEWLSSISERKENNEMIYSASSNLERIANRISLLEKYGNEVYIICSDNNVVSTRIDPEEEMQSFSQIMAIIDEYLKFLRGEEITDSSNKLLDTLNYRFDTTVEPYIVWVYTILNQCRNK